MDIESVISELLKNEGIRLFSPLPLKDCTVTKKYLLEQAGIENGTVFICAVPYLSRIYEKGNANISAYCAVRDYHDFFDAMWKRVCGALSEQFPQNRFIGFADKSPIDERDAAARSGLGIIGKNGLLITEPYSSYIFLGELITDAEIPCCAEEPKYCEDCGKCRAACPIEELGQCLSALTQKKGKLTDKEENAIRKYNIAWGCDICQEVCPHTKRAVESGTAFTDIEYFLTDVIPRLDASVLNAMSDREFLSRAFSWRGRETVLRNLSLLEKMN